MSEGRLDQALALLNAGRLDQARAALLRILRSAPNDPGANSLLSRTLLYAGEQRQALHYALRVTELLPGNPEVWTDAAFLHRICGDAAAAHRCLDRALALSPAHERALCERITLFNDAGMHVSARRVAEGALAALGGLPSLLSLLAQSLLGCGRPGEALAALDALLARAADPWQRLSAAGGAALMSNYVDTLTPEQVFARHAAYGRELAAVSPAPPPPPLRPDAEKRPRVGIVSPDLRSHSVAAFMGPLLRHHDRSALDLTIIYTNRISDAVTARLKTLAPRWVTIDNVSDPALAERIRALSLDVVIELSGHTGGGCLPAMQLRPAPVLATYLGYPNTTAVPAIGFRIVDAHTDPPGPSDRLATERLIRIDPCFVCWEPPADAPPVSEPPSRTGPFTFGSFNAAQKLSDTTLRLWGRILREAPSARLVIKSSNLAQPELREELAARAAALGLDMARTELMGPVADASGHLGTYGRIDCALDPYPYHGTTTTCEALWMGVPVVTLAGAMHHARVGASLLAACGLQECIAHDEEGYVRIAAGLAAHPQRAADLRTGLRDRVRASPLCDGPGFCRRFEEAVRGMIRLTRVQ